MTRPLRIEFPGAFYHATSRGTRRSNIFEDNRGRKLSAEVALAADGRAVLRALHIKPDPTN